MQEITMNLGTGRSFKEVFEEFVISKTAQGVSEATLENYDYHMRNIARYFDIEQSFDEVRKKDFEIMVVKMRKAGIQPLVNVSSKITRCYLFLEKIYRTIVFLRII